MQHNNQIRTISSLFSFHCRGNCRSIIINKHLTLPLVADRARYRTRTRPSTTSLYRVVWCGKRGLGRACMGRVGELIRRLFPSPQKSGGRDLRCECNTKHQSTIDKHAGINSLERQDCNLPLDQSMERTCANVQGYSPFRSFLFSQCSRKTDLLFSCKNISIQQILAAARLQAAFRRTVPPPHFGESVLNAIPKTINLVLNVSWVQYARLST